MDLLNRPLEAYLAHRFGAETVLVSALKFPRGSSRETWFVEYRVNAAAPVVKVVFRADHPSGSIIPSSLEQEYFMYSQLSATAVPVAKVLWWEDDPSWVARPFYVREHVEGSWNVPHYHDPSPKYDALRVETSKEHIRKLALVHQVNWREMDLAQRLPAPRSEADAGRFFIESLEKQLAQFCGEPIPLFAAGAAWLKARAPAAPRIALCKGTNGLGEEVFHDGRIVAMSDWEEVNIGDPASDFAFTQELVSEVVRDGRTLWGLEQALDYYHSVSGIRVTRESVAFYRMVHPLKMLMFSHRAGLGTHTTPDAHIRQAWTGTEVLHVAKRMLAGAMGILPPLSAARLIDLNATTADL